ncbi:hypothetical protein [Streptomyces sp. 11-1-2]|uniref:hypothetical protein n=1 Tax=unclassified Streptomyces TaxID=2593676 RepID=UPI000B8D52F1|nr:hypothetical protein [Streptomyces sp. 11-1-2]ASQ99773.1 hypothetical protein CGL27_48355 [Streptomyces sp. 11-1-2]
MASTISRRDLKVPWFGPPMGPATLTTACLMEYRSRGPEDAHASATGDALDSALVVTQRNSRLDTL